jgi:hypothetical protein
MNSKEIIPNNMASKKKNNQQNYLILALIGVIGGVFARNLWENKK